MFLDDTMSIPLMDSFTICVDDKGRFIIPAATKVEVGENLHFRWSFDRTCLILENDEENERVFAKFESVLDDMMQEGKINYHKKLQLRRVFYGIYNFMPEVVGKGRKIKVPDQAIRQFGLTKKVRAMVKDNHLEIYNIKEYEYVKRK